VEKPRDEAVTTRQVCNSVHGTEFALARSRDPVGRKRRVDAV